MDLQEYFKKTEGVGILSTADMDGQVNGAVYAKPHFQEDGCLAFITHDKLTRRNLLSNYHAAYIFIEKGTVVQGVRLYLERKEEIQDNALIESISKRTKGKGSDPALSRFLVIFEVKKVLKLVGDKELSVDCKRNEGSSAGRT